MVYKLRLYVCPKCYQRKLDIVLFNPFSQTYKHSVPCLSCGKTDLMRVEMIHHHIEIENPAKNARSEES